MSTVVQQISLTDLSELYQIAYGGFETDAASWDNSKLLGAIRKNQKFNGSKLVMDQLVDLGGGQSSGSLPSSSVPLIYQPEVFAKSVYSTSVLDNQSMKTARRSGEISGWM